MPHSVLLLLQPFTDQNDDVADGQVQLDELIPEVRAQNNNQTQCDVNLIEEAESQQILMPEHSNRISSLKFSRYSHRLEVKRELIA